MTDPKCKHCNGEMKPGKALQSTFNSGMPDFPGDKNVVTLSPGGPGKLIDCLKCSNCGWSMAEPKGLFIDMIAEHSGLAEEMQAMDELTDERIIELAHRKATKYTHAVLVTGGPAFTFSKAHIVDFARAIEKEIRG